MQRFQGILRTHISAKGLLRAFAKLLLVLIVGIPMFFCIVILLLVVTPISCFNYIFPSSTQIIDALKINATSSTHNVASYCLGGPDPIAFVRFEIDPAEVDTFVQANTSKLSRWTRPIDLDRFLSLEYMHGGWHWETNGIKSYIALSGSNGPWIYQNVVIDTTDLRRNVVYVVSENR